MATPDPTMRWLSGLASHQVGAGPHSLPVHRGGSGWSSSLRLCLFRLGCWRRSAQTPEDTLQALGRVFSHFIQWHSGGGAPQCLNVVTKHPAQE